MFTLLIVFRRRNGEECGSTQASRIDFDPEPAPSFGGQPVDELRRLREEDSWTRGSGRSSKALAKYPDFRTVLMKPGSEMKEHHADARISIQTIQGRVRLQLPDRAVELGGGELMCLESGIAHDVKALEESAFLITVSWPGGSAEERHAMS